VIKDGAAARAGLRVHDIALRLGGKPLTDQGKLVELVQANGDKPVPLELVRGGEHLTINVTPHRRKRERLSWRVNPPTSFVVDVVRPGAVLTGPKDGGGNHGSGVVTGDFNNDGILDVFTVPGRVSAAREPQESRTSTAKRIDD